MLQNIFAGIAAVFVTGPLLIGYFIIFIGWFGAFFVGIGGFLHFAIKVFDESPPPEGKAVLAEESYFQAPTKISSKEYLRLARLQRARPSITSSGSLDSVS